MCVGHGVLKLPARPPGVWGGFFGHTTDTRPGVMYLIVVSLLLPERPRAQGGIHGRPLLRILILKNKIVVLG